MIQEKIYPMVVAELVTLLGIEPSQIKDDTNLVEDLSISSIEVFSLMASLESKFKISIREDLIRRMLTVHDVVDVVAELLEKNKNK